MRSVDQRSAARFERLTPRLVSNDGTLVAQLARADRQQWVIGSDALADICIAHDPEISAVHACITWVAAIGSHVVHDCGRLRGCLTGTAVDDVPVLRPTLLNDGARLRIGMTDLIYDSVIRDLRIVRWSRSKHCLELIPEE